MPCAAPNFAYEQRFALDGFAAPAKFSPESVVRLVCYVKTPSVCVKFAQPVLTDGAEVVAYFGV